MEFVDSWKYITDIFGCSSEFWNTVDYLSASWMLQYLREKRFIRYPIVIAPPSHGYIRLVNVSLELDCYFPSHLRIPGMHEQERWCGLTGGQGRQSKCNDGISQPLTARMMLV